MLFIKNNYGKVVYKLEYTLCNIFLKKKKNILYTFPYIQVRYYCAIELFWFISH